MQCILISGCRSSPQGLQFAVSINICETNASASHCSDSVQFTGSRWLVWETWASNCFNRKPITFHLQNRHAMFILFTPMKQQFIPSRRSIILVMSCLASWLKKSKICFTVRDCLHCFKTRDFSRRYEKMKSITIGWLSQFELRGMCHKGYTDRSMNMLNRRPVCIDLLFFPKCATIKN